MEIKPSFFLQHNEGCLFLPLSLIGCHISHIDFPPNVETQLSHSVVFLASNALFILKRKRITSETDKK